MAKATKSAPTTPEGTPAAGTEALAAARAAREMASKKDTFKAAVSAIPADTKLAPQAKAIVNLVIAAGDAGLTREALVTAMQGVVNTRQPLGRILAYYQKELQEKALVTVTKA